MLCQKWMDECKDYVLGTRVPYRGATATAVQTCVIDCHL